MRGRARFSNVCPQAAVRAVLRVSIVIMGLAVLTPQQTAALFTGFEAEESGERIPEAHAARAEAPSIDAYPLNGGDQIKIDGRLDEDVWGLAPSGAGFRMWDPDRGGAPSEQTVFKVAYDDDAIYFAVACLEENPEKISASLSRRDQFSSSDLVSIYIDPYHDLTTGYNFRVNPLGVQEDAYVFDDGNRDTDWDAVWAAETFADEHGWYAELRIPFSSIRYRQTSPTWGLQVYRYMHGRGEDTAWVTWDREISGFVSRFGTVTGLANIPAPRQLEIVPYAVARATDLSMEGPEEVDHFENFGMDLKYGITSDLTLNATIQPDFGQVEADPALLNLSPYETYFQEKRPFFIEGSRFFQHPGFNLFYSRRIGTGSENCRIRHASKLTGKTAGDFSLAFLAAGTDMTDAGQAHNTFKNGDCSSQYYVGRVGREFSQGNHSINLMQTVVMNDAARDDYGNYASREAYTSGLDFKMQFRDRTIEINGCAVGSIIDPEPLASDPDYMPAKTYGTGGELSLIKRGGTLRGSMWGRWETGKLDLNDIGFLSAPDEINYGFWFGHNYSPDGDSKLFNRANTNLNFNQSWLYADRTANDLHTGEPIWSYPRGHRGMGNSNVNGWLQLRSFWETWYGLTLNPEGSQRYDTRNWVVMENGDEESIPGGGPLIDEPLTWGGWWGLSTDSRTHLVGNLEINYYNDTADNASWRWGTGLRWNQSSAINHRFQLGYRTMIDDTQHLTNVENPGGGIGGVSYVYGNLHRKILDMTLRTNILFSRNKSLELYVQPYLTIGNYVGARELMRPDSYDLETYEADGFDYNDHDFTYMSTNLNAVYRWEYRPGSTFYLVWTHSRYTYDSRDGYSDPNDFECCMSANALFDNEPENVFLAKFSYWIPI